MYAFGFHQAWIDRVDADLAGAEFLGQDASDGVDGALGCGVDDAVRRSQAADRGTDIDDAAPLRADQLRRFLGAEDQPENVGVEVLAEMLFVHIFERLQVINAGVVHQNVELAVGLFGFREQAIDVGGLGDIGLNGDSLSACAGDFCHDAIGVLLAGCVVHYHGRAFRRELLGDGRADAFGCSGYHCDLAFEFLCHVLAPD